MFILVSAVSNIVRALQFYARCFIIGAGVVQRFKELVIRGPGHTSIIRHRRPSAGSHVVINTPGVVGNAVICSYVFVVTCL